MVLTSDQRTDNLTNTTQPWWSQAVLYHLDVRSFTDSDGDAIGDVEGLRARVGYLELLGIDAFVVNASPGHGPESFNLLIDEAHESGLRIVIHTTAGAEQLRHLLELGIDGVHRPGADDSTLAIVEEYPERMLVEADLGFTTPLAEAGFNTDELAHIITTGLTVDNVPTWPLTGDDHVLDDEVDAARARAMALVALALPGATSLRHGDELGLPSGYGTLMPWEGEEPPFGFSEAPGTWTTIPTDWAHRTVEAQMENPDSTLTLYRHGMELRRTHPGFHGSHLEWFGAPQGCLAFRRGGDGIICAINGTSAPVPLPPGELLLASQQPQDGQLAARSTALLA